MAEQIFCKNCSKKIHPNEGCYNTPMGIYCISCYDKKIKETKLIIKNNKNMQENNKKEDNSQEFRIGDKVIDILLYEVGVVQDIEYSPNIPYGLSVEFKSGLKSYTINGCYIPECKNPQLLHYRDDYDYSIIDFNNLPKRQEAKRWRAKEGETYYSFSSKFEVKDFCEDGGDFDNKAYKLGNYFKTKEEAEIIAQKLNTYFKQLIEEPIRAIDLPLSEMQKGMLEEQKPKKTLTCYLGNDMSN